MLEVIKPSWNLFDRLVAEAKAELVICVPWISSAGLQRLSNLLLNAAKGTRPSRVQLWARVADINTDSPGLLDLIRRLGTEGISTVVRDSPVLHAKVYLADHSLALVTSANLSEGGFSSNLEAAVVISEPEGIEKVTQLLAEIEAETDPVSVSDLEHFVTKQRPLLAAQTPPEAPLAIVPAWRRPGEPAAANLGQSRGFDLLELIKSVETSVQAAQAEIQHIDLNEWIGKKAVVWACPCEVIAGPSPRLKYITAPFYSGELRLDQLLAPERFTQMEGTIERVIEHGRALFRKKRSRKAGIELTRYPDRGSGSILWPSGRDPHFLLKIQAAE
jgi:hypothetical protein